MARQPIYDWELLASSLDAAIPHDRQHGWSIGDIANSLRLPTPHHAYRVNQFHRRYFGSDSYALVCTRGPGAVYWLSDDPIEIAIWERGRGTSIESQIRTVHAVSERRVKLTNARSKEGRIARDAEMTLRHLMERLDHLNGV
jgi:hypothetical protein